MAKKSDKTEFREYLHTVLKTIPDNAPDIYYESQVDAIYNMAKNVFTAREEPVADKEDIDAVYSSYPTRCVVQGRSLGKSGADKKKIARLLRDKDKGLLIQTIQRYTEECKRDKVYMKNFGTFLNNLPEYDLTEKPKTVEISGYRDLRKITEAQ